MLLGLVTPGLAEEQGTTANRFTEIQQQVPPGASASSDSLVYMARLHYFNDVWLNVTNSDVFGSAHNYHDPFQLVAFPVLDMQSLSINWAPSFEFPPRSRLDYLYEAAMWFGCIRFPDTLVSSVSLIGDPSIEFASGKQIVETTNRRSSGFFDPNTKADQEFYAENADTGSTLVRTNYDWVYRRQHRPIGIEVHQTSYAWASRDSRRFILINFWIQNISDSEINDACVGFYVNPAVYSSFLNEGGSDDDVVGLLKAAPARVPGFLDTLNVAWAGDNDGDPGGAFTYGFVSPTGVLGARILRSPCRSQVNFNWWAVRWGSRGGELVNWGPHSPGITAWNSGSEGIPEGDRGRYRMMTDGEIDYNQVDAAKDHVDSGWSPPLLALDANDVADGLDVFLLLSCGPFGPIAPGDSVPFTVALVAGYDFHTDPRNFADRFNPANPQPYLDHLDFTDLIKNARWAGWVFDNPGVDTDHDNFRGKAHLVNCGGVDTLGFDTTITGDPPETTIVPITASRGCDSVFYEGDGVPDWKGPEPPYAPQFELTTEPGKVILRWTGVYSETETDPLSHKRDFEGYRMYAGRFATDDQFSLVASWDKEDFKRMAYDAETSRWMQISDPLSMDQWRAFLGNPTFDPGQYPVPSLSEAYRDSFWDTTRNLQGEVVGVAHHERFSYWAPESYNRANRYWDTDHWETNLIQRTGSRDTIIDGHPLSYGIYEATIDNLQASVPLFFAVACFDFGDYAERLDPLESSPSNNYQYGQPIYSSNVVVDSGLKVSVYPNPYKISYNDALGHRTTYFAEGYEGRGKPEFTEYDRRIHFINLPDTATIRIYSLAGDLIRVLHHPDKHLTTYSSSLGWDLVSRNAQAVTSGIYIWRVDSKLGSQIGKLVIIK